MKPKTDDRVNISLPEEWRELAAAVEAKLVEQGKASEGRGRSVAIRFGLACAAEKLRIKTKLKP